MAKPSTTTLPDMSTQGPTTMEENSVEMRIPARAEWVRVVRLATAGVAARVGFSYDDIEDLKLAVAEACNNAILHGKSRVSSTPSTASEEARAPWVTIRWTILPDRLQISVTDEGRLESPGLPLQPVENLPDELPDELPEGGMGLLLIQTLMDEVEHDSGPHLDTTLRLTKYAPPAPKPTRALRAALSTSARRISDSASPKTTGSTTGSTHRVVRPASSRSDS